MQTRITLSDIARHVDCSISTVSLALHDSPRLSDAKRAAVQLAAQQLGYRPDPVLSALSSHRWHRPPVSAGSTLAFIADIRVDDLISMETYARHFGYRLETFDLRDYPTGRDLSNILYNRGITGVLIGQIATPGFVESFDWSHFSSVAISKGDFRPPAHLVCPNHFGAVQSSWDYARQMGGRRIGLIVFEEPGALDFHDRRAAFLERQLNMPASRRVPVLSITSEDVKRGIHRVIDAWIGRHKPDVVLGFNETFYWGIKDGGWRVPEQIKFISLWKMEKNPAFPGQLLSLKEINCRAIDWLDTLLRSGVRGLPEHPATMEIDMKWSP